MKLQNKYHCCKCGKFWDHEWEQIHDYIESNNEPVECPDCWSSDIDTTEPYGTYGLD